MGSESSGRWGTTKSYYALNKGRPPTPYQYASEEQWLQSLTREHRFTIWLEDHELPHGVADYDFWVVAAHNKDGAEMFREDLVGVAIDQFIQSIPRQRTYIVYTPEQLASWTVWPHSKTQGWLNRITKPIDHIPA